MTNEQSAQDSSSPSFDIATRLAQWKQEATNPDHPNYHHAELDWPADRYAVISPLAEKLRTTPEEFSRDDLVTLLGRLNSGQRTKNKVADNNPLPELRQTLLALLDGPGEPADKIRQASAAIRFAGPNMLGELYGWVHAEDAPLVNQCAIDALRHLGYSFGADDYVSVVVAHEQLKPVYVQSVGRLRPDIPLNLEMDRFYNVIDKVDLKGAIANVYELLKAGESAIVLFTRGANTEIRDDGSGYTGNWRLDPARVPKRVLLYFREDTAEKERNTVFEAEAGELTGPNDEGRYRIGLAQIRRLGTTRSNWHSFTGARSDNPVFYTRGAGQALAQPFAGIFATRELADRAFDMLADAVTRLGYRGSADIRFALTLPSGVLRLNCGSWWILSFARNRMTVALLAELVEGELEYQWRSGPFRLGKQETRLYRFPFPLSFEDNASQLFERAFVDSMKYASELFSAWEGSPPRRAHREEVFAALFDEVTRSKLLVQGLQGDWEFTGLSAEAFEFLSELATNNNKEWFAGNRDRFETELREPFRRLISEVGRTLKPELDPFLTPDALEIEPKADKVLSHINRRNRGPQGEQYYTYYWGAFYRQLLTKQTDAQLFLNMQHDRLRVGFYVSRLAGECHARFRDRVLRDPERVFLLLKDRGLLDTCEFERTTPEGERIATVVGSAIDLQEWLADGDYDLLRSFDRDDPVLADPSLADTVAETLRQVFPVYLLAIADDPWPLVKQHCGWPNDERHTYDSTQFLAETSLLSADLDDLLSLIEEKRQLILYGPPGTGKTYVAQRLARLLIGLQEPPPERMEIIQFHPAYGYEDFMEGIRPESKPAGDGRYIVDYPVMEGAFVRFCRQAQTVPGPCVLIIDEINRGNLARIFGELMFLLEYRTESVRLPYSGERFQVPENVIIIGTMNTADRSIALVDFALRRRFHFFRLGADVDLLDRWLSTHSQVSERVPYLLALYRELAAAIDDSDFAIGPGYFMDRQLDERRLQRVWRFSVEPYLAEYYLEQPARQAAWRWDGVRVMTIRKNYA